jgi:hypothetical protein
MHRIVSLSYGSQASEDSSGSIFLQRPDVCKLFNMIDDFTDAWREAPTVLFVHGLPESD